MHYTGSAVACILDPHLGCSLILLFYTSVPSSTCLDRARRSARQLSRSSACAALSRDRSSSSPRYAGLRGLPGSFPRAGASSLISQSSIRESASYFAGSSSRACTSSLALSTHSRVCPLHVPVLSAALCSASLAVLVICTISASIVSSCRFSCVIDNGSVTHGVRLRLHQCATVPVLAMHLISTALTEDLRSSVTSGIGFGIADL